MSASRTSSTINRLTFIALGAVILAASLLESPSIQASIIAGLSSLCGLAVMSIGAVAPGSTPGAIPPPPPVQIVHRVVEQPKNLRLFKLDNAKGYVAFQVIDGKLVSKMVDAGFVTKMMNTPAFSC